MSTNEPTNYCTECQGRPHAPWCSQYVNPQVDQTASSCCEECDYSDEQEKEQLRSPMVEELTKKFAYELVHFNHDSEKIYLVTNITEDGMLELDGMSGQFAPSLFQRVKPSPALRNTKSIVHHAEMVEEQIVEEREVAAVHNLLQHLQKGECDCSLHRLSESERGELFDQAIDQTNAEIRANNGQLIFEQCWQEAPKSIKHGCEEISAEFFYYAGRRDRETEMLRDVNETLRGVVERIAGERLR